MMNRWPEIARRLAIAVLLAVGALIAPGRSSTAAIALASDCPWQVNIDGLAAMSSGQGLACYGGRLLTFEAYVPAPCSGCGGMSAFTVSPRWLDSVFGSTVNLSAGPGRPEQLVFVPPTLGRCAAFVDLKACPFHPYSRRRVVVSAHFDDPVAATCRYSEHPAGPGFSREDAVTGCQASLVVLSVRPDPLPATDSVATAAPARAGPPPALIASAPVALLLLMLALGRRNRRGPHE